MNRLFKKAIPAIFMNGLNKCNQRGMRIVRKNNVVRFLDVGCGDGSLTVKFAEQIHPESIYGVEYVAEARACAESRGIVCKGFDLNGRWDYESNYFDVILSSQNIEHMHNTRLYLEECYRCLRPGGQLVVLTENLSAWDNIGALCLGWQPFSTTNINGWNLGNPWIWHADEPKDTVAIEKNNVTGISGLTGHVRVLAYRGLKDMMKKVGFTDITISTKGYFPLWGALSDALCWLDKRHGHFIIASGNKK